jgi:hypothetical protein
VRGERKKGKWAGGGLDGPLARVGEKGKAGGGVGGLEEKVGRAGKRKGGRKGGGPHKLLGRRGCWATGWKRKEGEKREEGFGKFSFSFLNLFKLTFQTFEIELFSKHSKIFKTFLKAFKTSHKQIINAMQPKDDAQALIASKLLK